MYDNDSNNPSSVFLPRVVRNLLIINVLIWLAQWILPQHGINLTRMLGMHYFEAGAFRPYQLLTYMFLHDDKSFTHLFFNMYSLVFFGAAIEMLWGARRFLLFYIATGLTAALAQQAVWYYELHDIVTQYQSVDLGSTVVTMSQFLNMHLTVGASGAVFGLLLAFGMLFPNTPLFLFFIPVPIKAKYFVLGYGLIELFMGVYPSTGDSVAHFAHLGGLIGGVILILLWRKRGVIDGPYN